MPTVRFVLLCLIGLVLAPTVNARSNSPLERMFEADPRIECQVFEKVLSDPASSLTNRPCTDADIPNHGLPLVHDPNQALHGCAYEAEALISFAPSIDNELVVTIIILKLPTDRADCS